VRRLIVALAAVSLVLSMASAKNGPADLIVTIRDGWSVDDVDNDNGTHTLDQIPGTSVHLLRLDNGDALEDVLNRIRQHPAVEGAEPNRTVKLDATAPPSPSANLGQAMADLLDTNAKTIFYGTYVLQAYATQPAMQVIHLSGVRNLSTGAGTRVAYIDTGVDPYHPALTPWLEPGVDLVAGISSSETAGLSQAMADLLDPASFIVLNANSVLATGVNSSHAPPAWGHGTMVAGLIHLIAPEARIFPIKAFDANGYTSTFQLVGGVYAAIYAGADVLSMSFSMKENSQALHRALDRAKAAHIALVAAVGNESQYVANRYPASYRGVCGIAATDQFDVLASFSNYGPPVCVTAPGVGVISTAPGGRYALASGTSFSTPIVAGAMALAASVREDGDSSPMAVINTADSIDAVNPGFVKQLGKGRIDVARALTRQ